MKEKHCLVVFFCKAVKTLACEGRSTFFTLIYTLNLLPNEHYMARKQHKGESCMEELLCFFLRSNYFKYMQDVNQQGIRLSSNHSHECNQYRFHGGWLVQIRIPINVCSSMFALNEWKNTRSLSLAAASGARWSGLYRAEHARQSFLPSCKPALNLINKDEILSVMKFTLNHRSVSGHRDRSSIERIVYFCPYL